MPLRSTGSLTPRTTKTKGKKYTRYYIYLPADLVDDSQFPFDLVKQDLEIEIDGNRLVVHEPGYPCPTCGEYVTPDSISDETGIGEFNCGTCGKFNLPESD